MKKLILFLAFGIIFFSLVGGVLAATTFTPIYCNQYSFTCCASQVEGSTITMTLNGDSNGYFQCPSTSSGCKVKTATSTFYLGDGNNCAYRTGWRYLGVYYFHCDNDQEETAPFDLKSGQIIYGGKISPANTQIDVYKNVLLFTGRAGSSSGTEVLGAEGCTFNPSNTKDSSGALVNFDISGTSYSASLPSSLGSASSNCVLTWLAGDRVVCGNIEEQCTSNIDCSGHTYGNKECTGRTLQTYGCIKTGESLPSGVKSVDGQNVYFNTQGSSPSFGDITASRCDLENSEPVQCCGDIDCGTNMFCDNNPSSPTAWTCQKKVECNQNSDCGTSVQCDWTTNNLKTPTCENGRCTFKEEKVDCCLDKNCDDGSYCNANHKCQEGVGHNIDVEKSNNTPIGGFAQSSTGGSSTGTIILIIFIVLILGSAGFFIYSKNKKGKSKNKFEQNSTKTKSSTGNHCTKCGHPLTPGSKFCTKCGKKLK